MLQNIGLSAPVGIDQAKMLFGRNQTPRFNYFLRDLAQKPLCYIDEVASQPDIEKVFDDPVFNTSQLKWITGIRTIPFEEKGLPLVNIQRRGNTVLIGNQCPTIDAFNPELDSRMIGMTAPTSIDKLRPHNTPRGLWYSDEAKEALLDWWLLALNDIADKEYAPLVNNLISDNQFVKDSSQERYDKMVEKSSKKKNK